MKSIQKEYGSNWQKVYYSLANKRAGKGLRGKHRGHRSANVAYQKGSHWTVKTKGKANISRRQGGHTVKIHVH